MLLAKLNQMVAEGRGQSSLLSKCIAAATSINDAWDAREATQKAVESSLLELVDLIEVAGDDEVAGSMLVQKLQDHLKRERELGEAYERAAAELAETVTFMRTVLQPSAEEPVAAAADGRDEIELSAPSHFVLDKSTLASLTTTVEKQVFTAELEDGTEAEAELLAVVEIDGKTYAIYSIDNDDGTVDVLASYVLKDDEGYDYLTSISDPADKEKVLEFVESML